MQSLGNRTQTVVLYGPQDDITQKKKFYKWQLQRGRHHFINGGGGGGIRKAHPTIAIMSISVVFVVGVAMLVGVSMTMCSRILHGWSTYIKCSHFIRST